MKTVILIPLATAFLIAAGLAGMRPSPAKAVQQLAQKAEDPEIIKIRAMIKDKRDRVEKKRLARVRKCNEYKTKKKQKCISKAMAARAKASRKLDNLEVDLVHKALLKKAVDKAKKKRAGQINKCKAIPNKGQQKTCLANLKKHWKKFAKDCNSSRLPAFKQKCWNKY